MSDTHQLEPDEYHLHRGEQTVQRVSQALKEPIDVATKLLDGHRGFSVLTVLAGCHIIRINTPCLDDAVSS